MFKLATLLVVLAYAYAKVAPDMMNVPYYDRPIETRIKMMGTFLDGNSFSQDHEIVEHDEDEAAEFLATAPASFDSKTKWPGCANVIGYIKDQAACGSCWAVSASEVIADRECITCSEGKSSSPANQNVDQTPGNEAVPWADVSAEQIMACCSYCGDGCQGGYPIDAMKYYCETGVVSGGWYNSKCGCQSYKVSPTSRTEGPTPACSSSCDDPSYPVTFAADKRFCNKYYSVKGESAMMNEIMTNGPIECGFTVKQSFETFFKAHPTGIYVNPHKWFDRTLGGHAIKVYGWGVSGGQKYWLINNSWNTTWGNSGSFKYAKGKNLDGMEAGCVAATPKCNLSNAKSKTLQCKDRDY